MDTGDNDVCIDGNFLALGDLMDIEELDKYFGGRVDIKN